MHPDRSFGITIQRNKKGKYFSIHTVWFVFSKHVGDIESPAVNDLSQVMKLPFNVKDFTGYGFGFNLKLLTSERTRKRERELGRKSD